MAVATTALAAIPWDKVIKYAPQVADVAKSLWKTVKSDKPKVADQHATLIKRVDQLAMEFQEHHDQMLAATEIIARLADQNSQLSLKMRRLTYCSVFAVVTSVIGLIATLRSW